MKSMKYINHEMALHDRLGCISIRRVKNLATYLLMPCDVEQRYLDGIYVVGCRVYIDRFPFLCCVFVSLSNG